MEVNRPPDHPPLTGFMDYVWVGLFIGTIPCFFIHSKIIFYSIFSKCPNAANNLLVANMAFGGTIYLSSIGIYVVENRFYNFYKTDVACGIRAIIFRLGAVIVTFTLTKIVQEARKSLHKNPLYQHLTPSRPLVSIILINLFSFIILLPVFFSTSFNSKQNLCVKDLLFDSEWADWASRILALLVVELIPFYILIKEIKEIVKFTRNHQGFQDSELGAFVQRKRLDLLRTSFAFISIFIFVTFPCSIVDILYSPTITLPPKVTIIRDCIMSVVYVLAYLTIQVFPIYIFYAYRKNPTYL